jgi:hypothetical protein
MEDKVKYPYGIRRRNYDPLKSTNKMEMYTFSEEVAVLHIAHLYISGYPEWARYFPGALVLCTVLGQGTVQYMYLE